MATQDDEHDDEHDDEFDDDIDDDQFDDDIEDDEFDDKPDDEAEPEEPAPTRPVRAATPVPAMDPNRSDVSNKWRVDRLDERERRFSFIAAAAAAALGIIIYVVQTSNHHFRLTKGQLTPQTTLIVGLVAGALLLAATRLGRRAPVGFVALLTGAAFQNTSLLLALPFFALAIWILVRSYKVQKQATATLRATKAAAAGRSTPPTRSSATTRSGSAPPARKPAPTRKRSKGPVTPPPNKRYTPKKPAPPPMPAPKLSRRERKQSTTSD
jgi:hypothetical protein